MTHLISIKQSFSLFVIAIMIVVTVLLTAVTGVQLSHRVTQLTKQNTELYLMSILHDMDSYAKVRLIDAEGMAKFPDLIQGLMQPENHLASVADLFKDMTIQGEQPQQLLINYSGDVIYSRYSGTPFEINVDINDETESQISPLRVHDKLHLQLSVPVKYQGYVEGLLVTLIPIEKLITDLELEKRIENMNLSFIDDSKPEFKIGSGNYPIEKRLNHTWLGYEVEYQADDQAIKSLVAQLQTETFILMLVIGLTCTGLAIFYGQRVFVEPIRKLSKLMQNFGENKEIVKDYNSPIKELDRLSSQFETLTKRIASREKQLKDAYVKIKDNQNQLLQSEKMASLGMLSAGIAHEINNPLGFIKSNIETLSEYNQSFERVLEIWMSTEDSTSKDRLNELTNLIQSLELPELIVDSRDIINDSILGLGRIEDIVHGLKLFSRSDGDEKVNFSAENQLSLTLKLAWNELKYNAKVTTTIVSDFNIHGHPGQINQIILNFLVNAVHAIGTQGTIDIEVGLHTSGLGYISVKDSGYGIKEEHLKELFNPFFTTKPPGEGTGLGLSISYSIAKKHGGEIIVESKEGEGSTFTLLLPRVED